MTARWHFDPRDTPEHRRTLRQSRSAQKVRAIFPAGTRVQVRNDLLHRQGTIERHVPGHNAQGGVLLITWDFNGVTGRTSAINVEPIEEKN